MRPAFSRLTQPGRSLYFQDAGQGRGWEDTERDTLEPLDDGAYRFRGTKGYLEEPATFYAIHFAIIFYRLSGRL